MAERAAENVAAGLAAQAEQLKSKREAQKLKAAAATAAAATQAAAEQAAVKQAAAERAVPAHKEEAIVTVSTRPHAISPQCHICPVGPERSLGQLDRSLAAQPRSTSSDVGESSAPLRTLERVVGTLGKRARACLAACVYLGTRPLECTNATTPQAGRVVSFRTVFLVIGFAAAACCAPSMFRLRPPVQTPALLVAILN